MTDNSHPITPPPELVQQWWDGTHGAFYEFEAVVTQAARWGADEQLEMDATWVALQTSNQMSSKRLIAEMRPKPLSLKESNLKHLEVMERDGHYLPEIISDLRRAIESLPS
jgi:hypothetical protein